MPALDKTITSEPTKNLFITMLVKDLTLKDAIEDLVDNSVDAAKHIAKDPNNLNGFHIEIQLNKAGFEIKDNCSGLEAEDARNNASASVRVSRNVRSDNLSCPKIGLHKLSVK